MVCLFETLFHWWKSPTLATVVIPSGCLVIKRHNNESCVCMYACKWVSRCAVRALVELIWHHCVRRYDADGLHSNPDTFIMVYSYDFIKIICSYLHFNLSLVAYILDLALDASACPMLTNHFGKCLSLTWWLCHLIWAPTLKPHWPIAIWGVCDYKLNTTLIYAVQLCVF